MKLKKLLIPAVILFLIGGTVKICDTLFNVNGDGFILSSQACNLTLAASFLLLYIIAFALSVADRKKTFLAVPTKSVPCGIFGFIASVALIGSGVVRLIAGGGNLAESIMAIIAGFLLLYEACISLTGSNGMKKMPVAALILPVWCCVRFVGLFIDYSQKSLKATELFDIVAIGFLIMFLFYQSMFLAGINNRLAVRKTVVYGSVYIMLGLIVNCDLIIKMLIGKQPIPNVDSQIVEPSVLNIITIAGDIALCCYAFFLIRSMLKNADEHLTMPDEELNDDIIVNEDAVLKVEEEVSAMNAQEYNILDINMAETTAEPYQAEYESSAKPPVVRKMPPELKKTMADRIKNAVRKKTEPTDTPEQAEQPEPKAEKTAAVNVDPEQELPKVAEPAKPVNSDDKGAYDELFKMLDEIK